MDKYKCIGNACAKLSLTGSRDVSLVCQSILAASLEKKKCQELIDDEKSLLDDNV